MVEDSKEQIKNGLEREQNRAAIESAHMIKEHRAKEAKRAHKLAADEPAWQAGDQAIRQKDLAYEQAYRQKQATAADKREAQRLAGEEERQAKDQARNERDEVREQGIQEERARKR